MTIKAKNILGLGISGLFLALQALLLVPPALAAESANFIIPGGSYAVGASFSVPISENSGDTNVNVVQADLTYNPQQLELLSIDTTSSTFGGGVNPTGGGGSISIIRFAPFGTKVSGTARIAVLNFRHLKNSSSTVSFAQSSHILSTSAQDIWTGNPTSGTYSFKAPAVAVAPAPASTAAPDTSTGQQQPSDPPFLLNDRPTTSNLGSAGEDNNVIFPYYIRSDYDMPWGLKIALSLIAAVTIRALIYNFHRKAKLRRLSRKSKSLVSEIARMSHL